MTLFKYKCPRAMGEVRCMWTFILIAMLGHLPTTADCLYLKVSMDKECGNNIDLGYRGGSMTDVEFFLSDTLYNQPYNACVLTLTAPADKPWLMFYFSRFDVPCDGGVEVSVIESADGTSSGSGLSRLCGSNPGFFNKVYNSTRYLRFQTEWSASTGRSANFLAIVTTYSRGTCVGEDYQCDNGRCIDGALTCNNYNPCGDNSDCKESSTTQATDSNEVPVILQAILGPIFFLGFIIIARLMFIRHRMHFGNSRRNGCVHGMCECIGHYCRACGHKMSCCCENMCDWCGGCCSRTGDCCTSCWHSITKHSSRIHGRCVVCCKCDAGSEQADVQTSNVTQETSTTQTQTSGTNTEMELTNISDTTQPPPYDSFDVISSAPTSESRDLPPDYSTVVGDYNKYRVRDHK